MATTGSMTSRARASRARLTKETKPTTTDQPRKSMTLSRQERWRNAATETWKRGLSDEDRAIAEHDEAMMGTEGAMDLALTQLVLRQ